MIPTRNSPGDGPVSRPVRTSDRLRRRPKIYGRTTYIYCTPPMLRSRNTKSKARKTATRIAKMFSKRPVEKANSNSVATNLRLPVNLESYTDSSGSEDEAVTRPSYRSLRNEIKGEKIIETKSTPRCEGLWPRRTKTIAKEKLKVDSAVEQDSSEDKVVDLTENGNEIDSDDAEDDQNGGEAEDEGDRGDEGKEDDDDEEGEEDEDEEEEEEEEEEEQDGRRRYDLRNRAEVRRHFIDQGKQTLRSPRRVLHQGMGNKVNRDIGKTGSWVHKRHWIRGEDFDDSLLVDELDQGPSIPWARGGGRLTPSWLFGGLDMHGNTAWGLNVVASGWGHQGDPLGTLSSGVQTAGPSSKGGADIQPLQVDGSMSFDDIGGLSEYVDEGDAFYRDGEETIFPLNWTKVAAMLAKVEYGQLTAAEAKTVLYLLSMKNSPKDADLLTLTELQPGEYLESFRVPREELLVDLRGGLTNDGACDSKKRIVKKRYILEASGQTSLFTSAYKHEKQKGKMTDTQPEGDRKDRKRTVDHRGEDDAPMPQKTSAGQSRDSHVEKNPSSDVKGSKRKRAKQDKSSKKHKKKKSKHGVPAKVLNAPPVLMPVADTGNNQFEVLEPDFVNSIDALEKVVQVKTLTSGCPPMSRATVDQTMDVDPSSRPVRRGLSRIFDPAANVDWYTTVDDISLMSDMELLQQQDEEELVNDSIGKCIRAVIRVRALHLKMQQKDKTLQESERQRECLVERELELSNKVSEHKTEVERLRRALEAAYSGERKAIIERGHVEVERDLAVKKRDKAKTERDQAVIKCNNMAVTLAEVRQEAESFREAVREKDTQLEHICNETWHNCLQQIRLKHGGVSVSGLSPHRIVVGGKIVPPSPGLVPDTCDRSYPTDSSSSDASEDTSSDDQSPSLSSSSLGSRST